MQGKNEGNINEPVDYFTQLPNETLDHIFSSLNTREKGLACQTSKVLSVLGEVVEPEIKVIIKISYYYNSNINDLRKFINEFRLSEQYRDLKNKKDKNLP